jgi:hypothetical protein
MHYIYYSLFHFSKCIADIVPSELFRNPKYDAVFYISLLELLNIYAIKWYFDIDIITSNSKLELAIFSVILLSINSLYFFLGKRYKLIIDKVEKEGKSFIANSIAFSYVILSSIAFFYTLYFLE